MAAARAGLIAAGLLLVVGAGMGRCSAGAPEVVTKVVSVPTVVTHTETKEITQPYPTVCKQMVSLTEGVTKSANQMTTDIKRADDIIDQLITAGVEPKDLQEAVDAQAQLKVLYAGINDENYRYLQLNESLKHAKDGCAEALDK